MLTCEHGERREKREQGKGRERLKKGSEQVLTCEHGERGKEKKKEMKERKRKGRKEERRLKR